MGLLIIIIIIIIIIIFVDLLEHIAWKLPCELTWKIRNLMKREIFKRFEIVRTYLIGWKMFYFHLFLLIQMWPESQLPIGLMGGLLIIKSEFESTECTGVFREFYAECLKPG